MEGDRSTFMQWREVGYEQVNGKNKLQCIRWYQQSIEHKVILKFGKIQGIKTSCRMQDVGELLQGTLGNRNIVQKLSSIQY